MMNLAGLNITVRIALLSQLLMNTATFMVIPLLTVFMTHNLKMEAAVVGTILAIYAFSARGLTFISAPLCDCIGPRFFLISGMLLRSMGMLGFVFSQQPLMLIIFIFLSGLGITFYESAIYQVFSSQNKAKHKQIFVLNNQVLNIGVIAGPLIGIALIHSTITLPFLISAIIFFILAIILFLVIKPYSRFIAENKPHYRHHLVKVVTNKSFMKFLGIATCWWFLFSQLYVSFPLFALRLTGLEQSAQLIFLVNGIIGIVIIIAFKHLFDIYQPKILLLVGFFMASLAYLFVPIYSSIYWLLFCIALYTIAETFILPSLEILTASYTDHNTAATYFAAFNLSWGIGGALGNYAGSWLMLKTDFSTPWFVYSVISLVAVITLIFIKLQKEEPHQWFNECARKKKSKLDVAL